jgi:hypothetical protein
LLCNCGKVCQNTFGLRVWWQYLCVHTLSSQPSTTRFSPAWSQRMVSLGLAVPGGHVASPRTACTRTRVYPSSDALRVGRRRKHPTSAERSISEPTGRREAPPDDRLRDQAVECDREIDDGPEHAALEAPALLVGLLNNSRKMLSLPPRVARIGALHYSIN